MCVKRCADQVRSLDREQASQLSARFHRSQAFGLKLQCTPLNTHCKRISIGYIYSLFRHSPKHTDIHTVDGSVHTTAVPTPSPNYWRKALLYYYIYMTTFPPRSSGRCMWFSSSSFNPCNNPARQATLRGSDWPEITQ